MLIRKGHKGWDKGEGEGGEVGAWVKGVGERAWLGGALVKT